MDGTILNKKYSLEERVKALEEGGGYVLPVATAKTLGGVKVGAGLSITNGVLSANSQKIDYSTAEQLTGKKWIDGKDLYQKTLQLPITSTSKIYPHGINNVDTIFINNSATFFVSNGTTENFYSAGYDDRGDYANGYNKIIQSVNATGVAIKAQSNTIENLVAIVTLNYTKTKS